MPAPDRNNREPFALLRECPPGCALEAQVSYQVTSAAALRAGKELRFRQRGNRVMLTLPELREFEVVALEG